MLKLQILGLHSSHIESESLIMVALPKMWICLKTLRVDGISYGEGVEERSGSINIYSPSSGRGDLTGAWALMPER